jgi:predicted dehydrogenase
MGEPATAPVRLAIVGAGGRGRTYARWAMDHPDRATVVAVAEPDVERRSLFRAEHSLDEDVVLTDWRALLDRPRIADAVVIATQDAGHREPAIALARLGYDVLLEKPLAPSEEDCRDIAEAAEAAGVVFAVCHVLLYAPYTRLIKEIIGSGRLGDVVSVHHLEPVGYWHQAHSYVRGNWRREADSSSMLMAKSCHDIDWLQHVVGEPATRVSSFGGIRHFTADNRPEGAANRCVDCVLKETCTFSATRFYGGLLASGDVGWPLDTVVLEPTRDRLDEALAHGPYGRCVYACDNDVVDHQVVNLEFGSGATASFTMTAFSEIGHRQTQIFGTRGHLTCDGRTISVREFGPELGSGTTELIDLATIGDATAGGGHGGGDWALMVAFTTAVAARDTSGIHSGPAASLSSHRTVFAAERARRRGTVETIDEL